MDRKKSAPSVSSDQLCSTTPATGSNSGRASLSGRKSAAGTSSEAEVTKKLLRFIGEDAQEVVGFQKRLFRTTKLHNPYLEQLVKVGHPERGKPDWMKANRDIIRQQQLEAQQHRCYRSRATLENKVMRVWIPIDPNEMSGLVGRMCIQTKHNQSSQAIILLVEDQITSTREVFEVMRLHRHRFSAAAMASHTDLAKEKEAHMVLSLRWKGIEVHEYVDEFERIEVCFESRGEGRDLKDDDEVEYWEPRLDRHQTLSA